MAQRRRTGSRSTGTRRRSKSSGPGLSLPSIVVSPEVARSLFGLVLLVMGVVVLIMIFLPAQQGTLTEWAQKTVNPLFGSGRYILPLLLIGGGAYVEWGSAPPAGWQWRFVAGAIAYLAFLGVLEYLPVRGGGRIGTFLASTLGHFLGNPVSVVVLAGVMIAATLIVIQRPLRSLVDPVVGAGRSLSSTVASARPVVDATAPLPGRAGRVPANGAGAMEPVDGTSMNGRRGRPPRLAPGDAPGQTGLFGLDPAQTPPALSTPPPISATIAPQRVPVADGPDGASLAAGARTADARPRPVDRDGDGVIEAGDAPSTRPGKDWVIPGLELLEMDRVPPPGDGASREAIHRHNETRIIEKLASFGIEAAIVGRNAGPVVTQYEVQPAAHIKVSRIEALSDDLAMALAARSIRIEAPIPGKSAVGIEIPNAEFNVVSLRRIFDEVDFSASGSKLMFALGRDVAGKATAVDLARMPHLLIAGATGSGKSVMVNALITSLLCKADPTEVRMILMDLKRVELAGYNGLPHLYVPVITEPERAKSALKWAVNEMENRYRRFAGATARNIKGFNETRADPADRMPYIVIVIDELADLMMREGKNIEDPIVRLAQKARATGIHMVLATQRPSVNVVTGLIKANFPSRIAFAMASQIDSRTILDAPGAEDLIGRGDMLYQPSDLPRPMRLQGVFVADPEINRITEHWRTQIDGDPHYDLSIITSDDESSGNVSEMPEEEADRLLPDAVSVIREYDRASASLLQRRLKVGYARAARMIDQLESRGYVGAFDGSNARVVLRRDDGPTAGDEDDA
ncbi:MAG TPA: DNA translocase FtsK [Candidatus Limnocylindrales bacterium]